MKIHEMQGQEFTLNLLQHASVGAILKEIRPVGFLFEVTQTDSKSFTVGQILFLSSTYPFSLSNVIREN